MAAPMTKLKHAGGRPTLYRREMCARLVDAMAGGLTAEAAAARIGISARSLFNWQKASRVFAGHSGRPPEVSAVVGRARPRHGQWRGGQHPDRDARAAE